MYDSLSTSRLVPPLRRHATSLSLPHTKPHVAVLSKTAFILLEDARSADKEFMAPRSSTHTVRSDLDKMIQVILDGYLVTEQLGRKIQGPPFVDPKRKGLVKIESGWIAKFLQEELLSEEEHHENLQNVRDIEDPDEISCYD